jgi:hypothetical protein
VKSAAAKPHRIKSDTTWMNLFFPDLSYIDQYDIIIFTLLARAPPAVRLDTVEDRIAHKQIIPKDYNFTIHALAKQKE